MTPNGTFTEVYGFQSGTVADPNAAPLNPQDGSGPEDPMIQVSGGNFVGTSNGIGGGTPVVFDVGWTNQPPAPVQLTLDPATAAVNAPVTLTWQVLNAFSQTAQLCFASIVGSPAGAGTWTGVQTGVLSNGFFNGSSTITPTANGIFTYALTCGGTESGFATLTVGDGTPLQIVPPATASSSAYNSAMGTNTVTVATNGLTLYTAATASPVNFGSVNVGQTSAAMTTTFTFDGPTTLSSVAGLLGGVDNHEIQIVSQGTTCAAQAYVAGNTCVVEANFSPLYPGPRQGAIVLYDNSTPARAVGVAYAYGLGVGPVGALVPGVITTVAGNGTASSTGDGGAASQATLAPLDMALDGGGNLFVVDQGASSNQSYPPVLIRRIDAKTGVITAFAGGGTGCASQTDAEGDGCLASQAILTTTSIGFDGAGNLYLLDSGFSQTAYVLRRIDQATGIITNVTPAGMNGAIAIGGIDGLGNVYIVQNLPSATTLSTFNLLEYNASTQQVTTLASNLLQNFMPPGETGSEVGVGAVDGKGNLFLGSFYGTVEVDLANGAIAPLIPETPTGFSGGGPGCLDQEYFNAVLRLDAAGNQYLSTAWGGEDSGAVCQTDNGGLGILIDVAGSGNIGGTFNGDNIPATAANLSLLTDFEIDGQGNLYIADIGLNRIRKVTVSTGTPIAFPSTAVGTVSSPTDVSVENIGNVSLPVSSIAVSSNFTTNDGDTTCSAGSQQIASGALCTLGIEFAPQTSGALSGTVTIADDSLNTSTSQQILLSGTATGATLTAQTITFTQPTTPVTYVSGLTIPLVATGGASGNPVVFTIDGSSTGTGTISGSTLTVTGVGSFVIDANQAGNSTYSTAPQVQRTVVVNQAPQTISFTQPTSPVTYSSGLQITLSATGGASGNPVVFTIDASSTATGSISGSMLTVTSTGNLVIDADQAGNANYSAATQVQRTIVVDTLLAQAITFTQPTTPEAYAAGLTIPLVATGGASENPVVFTLDASSTGAGSISSSTLTVTSVGSFVIDANQAGNSTYSAAPQVQRTVVINQASQAINFTQPTSPVTYTSGLQITLSATGGASGNAVVFSIDSSSTATGSISGSALTVTSAGNLVIDANQAGNADYSAAPQVQKTVVVNAPAPDFGITATPPSQSVAPGAAATYPITVTDSGTSFTSAVTLSVSGLPAGATGTFNPPTVTPGSESGTSTLTVTIAANTASLVRPNLWPIGTPVLALLFMLPFRRWRKLWRGKHLLLVAGLASLAGALSLMGCGGGFGLKTSQTYTLTITGTSGTDTHSTTVQLTVEQ